MTKRIAHAIDALNSKKTLFQVEKVNVDGDTDSQSDSENDKSDSDVSPEELK